MSREQTQVLDFETSAVFFALSPEKQVAIACRLHADAECHETKQAEAEQALAAKELEQQEKAKAPQELRAATEKKLKELIRPQQGEHVEYQALRIGQECGQVLPTDEDVHSSVWTSERLVLCMGHIMVFPVLVSKWTLRGCYSRKRQGTLRRRSYVSTIPSPRAAWLPHPPPCQHKGKLGANR